MAAGYMPRHKVRQWNFSYGLILNKAQPRKPSNLMMTLPESPQRCYEVSLFLSPDLNKFVCGKTIGKGKQRIDRNDFKTDLVIRYGEMMRRPDLVFRSLSHESASDAGKTRLISRLSTNSNIPEEIRV